MSHRLLQPITTQSKLSPTEIHLESNSLRAVKYNYSYRLLFLHKNLSVNVANVVVITRHMINHSRDFGI